jgi:hypothetical protein
MRGISKKKAISKIPGTLTRLLEISEQHVTFKKAKRRYRFRQGIESREIVLEN